ncbi:MAG: hypothetical protein RL617_617 [Pseudomonadota bacterium]
MQAQHPNTNSPSSSVVAPTVGRAGLRLFLIGSLFLTGCATQSNSGSVYRSGETQVEQVVRMGVVESVREVTVQRDSKGAGIAAGAVVGGIAGSGVSDNKRSSAIGGVLGALGGAIAGQMIEEQGNRRPGLEIMIKLDSGERRAIVQEADAPIRAGDRVRLIGSGTTVRVAPVQ